MDLLTGKAGPPLGKGMILVTASEVIDSCKKDGTRLFVDEEAEGCVLQGKVEATDEKHGPLVRLWKAVARHDTNFLEPGNPGFAAVKSVLLVPQEVHKSLSDQLANDCSDIRRLSTWPITRCFVYVDVSDFSQHLPGQQALIIGSLVSMVRSWRYWNGFALRSWQELEAMLCIGDGYIFVLKDAAHATWFAAHLAQLIEVRVARQLVPVEFHFRMGVHVGEVYCFWDWGRGGHEGADMVVERPGEWQRTELGNWNYIGDGINGGQRVLAAVGKETDDVLFISGQVRKNLTAKDEGDAPHRMILDCLLNRGRKTDKHNKFWRVYEVNHGGLCGDKLPPDAFTE
jgi:hypothetical protein